VGTIRVADVDTHASHGLEFPQAFFVAFSSTAFAPKNVLKMASLAFFA